MELQQLDQNDESLYVSLRGFEFDFNQDKWVLNRNITINLSFLERFNRPLAVDIRKTFLYFAENYSPKYVQSFAENIKKYMDISELDEFSVLGFQKMKLFLSKAGEPNLATVRTFVRQMQYLGLSGTIDDGIYKLFDQWSLSAGVRGVPVLSLDPENGPFSALEFEAIGMRAAQKFAEGKLSVEGYALISLFKATGRRPDQICSLKVKDFSMSSKHIGTPIYVVKIPRIKQGGQLFRSEFKAFGLLNYVGQIVEKHISNTVLSIQASLGRKLTLLERNELPLFVGRNLYNELLEKPLGSYLLDYLKTEVSHLKTQTLSSRLVSAVSSLGVISERTGQLIKINPYRFRYTIGTRAAIESAGKQVIATLLDHSDTQHTDVYVANVPEYAVEISKIMNQPLARYASAFAGRIIKDESEANEEVFGATRIPLREKDCDVGSCGSSAFCQDYAPIACYLCTKFRPWVGAPHHLVLQWLMEERKSLIDITNKDMTLVSINDRAIVAVCQVIKLCEEKKND
ncbi:site-specific integrase [Marinomonas lutimaris]|uniref:site-specific integrase n=1 Tax=Marinomonas lutimaris TaxID=2846746 RepID=UPI001CA470E2|nr:site-specific integrase [Marinomonas lutimaris]